MIGVIWNVAKIGTSFGIGGITGIRAGEAFVKVLPQATSKIGKVANCAASVGVEMTVGSMVTGAVYDGINEVERSCVNCKKEMVKNVKKARSKYNGKTKKDKESKQDIEGENENVKDC